MYKLVLQIVKPESRIKIDYVNIIGKARVVRVFPFQSTSHIGFVQKLTYGSGKEKCTRIREQ